MWRQKRQASRWREETHTSRSVEFPGHVGRQEYTKVLQHQAKDTPSGNESTSVGSGGTGLREGKGQNGPLPSRGVITSHVS